MQTKLKKCNGCDQLQQIWKSHGKFKYCRNCWYKLKPPKPLQKIAPKKRVELDEYSKRRLAYLAIHSNCQAKLVGCTSVSTDIHHKIGRTGNNLLNMSTWLSVCRSCHNWIELNPEDAKELGFSENRLI